MWSQVGLRKHCYEQSFSKCNLYTFKFSAHVLLNASLKDMEHYLTSTWNECYCTVVWTFFGIGMKAEFFQSCGYCWVFQICWHIECSTFTASPFWVWNSSAGIPSPPLALFVVRRPKAHLTSHPRMSGSRWVTTPLWLSGLLRPFSGAFLLCIFATSS